jgi:hypothetical protein
LQPDHSPALKDATLPTHTCGHLLLAQLLPARGVMMAIMAIAESFIF